MRTWFLSFALFAISAGADELARFQSVEPTSSQGLFEATLKFDRPFQPQTVVNYGPGQVEIDFKGEGRVARRESIKVQDALVRSIDVSQFSRDVIRVTLNLKSKVAPETLRGRLSAENWGSDIHLAFQTTASAQEEEGSDVVEETEQQPVLTKENNHDILAREFALPKKVIEPAAAAAATVTQANNDAAKAESPKIEAEPLKVVPQGESAKTEPQAESAKIESKAEAKAEKDIPVLTKLARSEGKSENPLKRLFMSLGVIIAVAGGLFMFTRFWSKRRSGIPLHHQIKVLTQFPLGPKRSLAIIRVAGESILIGITDHNISMIKELALLDEDIPVEVPQQFHPELQQSEAAEDSPREEFSFGTVKDVVASRLREMRSL